MSSLYLTTGFSCSIIAFLVVFYLPEWKINRRIQSWKQALQLEQHALSFHCLFSDVNGFMLSKEARQVKDLIDYTYGEIDFEAFIALLSLVSPPAETVFYDLGSGVGKAVLACAMVFKVKKSCGIEQCRALHLAATKKQLQWEQDPYYKGKTNVVSFINADFLDADFSDATLVFINATAFFGETWVVLKERLTALKTGAMVITTSKPLLVDRFILVCDTKVRMSWGVVRAYIQQHQ